MGFFSFRKKVGGSCKEGAICAWEFKGTLYKTKDLRDKAERLWKFNDAVSRLASYLEAPTSRMIFSSPKEYKEDLVQVWDDSGGPPKFIRRYMTPHQVAEKLVAEWPSIRDSIDSIVKENKWKL